MARAAFSNGRLTIDSRPRFVLGCYISGGSYSADPAKWEHDFFSDEGWGLHDIPINVVLPYTLGNMPIDSTRALLDVLRQHGISFLATGNSFNFGSWRRYGPNSFSIMSQSYVQQFAQHPAALGYYIGDEPAETLLGETAEHYRELKSWDPEGVAVTICMAGYVPGDPAKGIPGEATRTDPQKWADSCDILGVDPYPLYGPEPATGYAHFSAADYVSKCVAAARPGQPVWAVLQLFKFTSDSRLPTPDEMRAHAVMSIVEGAQGILWWDIGVNGLRKGTDPATVAAYMGHLRELVTELAALEPALVGTVVAGAPHNSTMSLDPIAGRIAQLQHNVSVDPLDSRDKWYQGEIAALRAGDTSKSGGMLAAAGSIRTRAFIADGQGWAVVFAYNYTNQVQAGTFDVPGLLSVMWSDVFGPYEARIYRLSLGDGGRLVIKETKTGQEYALGAAPPPPPIVVTQPPATPPAPPPPNPGGLTAEITYPAAGATVHAGTVTVSGKTSDWGRAKTFALSVDGVPIAEKTMPQASTCQIPWPATPGPHTLLLSVTLMATGQRAMATVSVTVSP